MNHDMNIRERLLTQFSQTAVERAETAAMRFTSGTVHKAIRKGPLVSHLLEEMHAADLARACRANNQSFPTLSG
jgi:hypothetical protein